MGKQLSMEKKMNEKDSNITVFTSYRKMYDKIAQLLADAKFYYLSAVFVLMKDLPEFRELRLKDHMEANRPPMSHNVTPRGIFLTHELITKARDTMVEKVRAHQKYIKPKFTEYFGDCIKKMNRALRLLDNEDAI
jgi:hypothetical protein